MRLMRSGLLFLFLLALVVSSAAGITRKDPVEFAGLVQKGVIYRAQISYDNEQGWRTVVKLRVPYHHAARIEWVNLNEFPQLEKPVERSRRQRIRFELVTREVVKGPGQNRWNTTYRCRIMAIE